MTPKRRIRFVNLKLNNRWTWDSLVYFRDKPKIGVDFEDFRMSSSGDFETEQEAKADQEYIEEKLGWKL